MYKKFVQYSESDLFWNDLVQIFGQAHQAASPNFRLAMSGGSALQLFSQLIERDYGWNEVNVFVADERCVALDHPDSNSGQMQRLLSETDANLNLYKDPANRAESLEDYKTLLKIDEAGTLFDLTILGVGPDGHVASLFPNSPALEMTELVVPSETDRFAVHDRMGLSFSALKQSKQIVLCLIGSSKSEIFTQMQVPNLDFKDYPVAELLSWPNVRVVWLND